MDPDAIREIPRMLDEDDRPGREIPMWDGKAGGRAASVLIEFLP
jgi:hypothetical protein